jgi:hypothetical protein
VCNVLLRGPRHRNVRELTLEVSVVPLLGIISNIHFRGLSGAYRLCVWYSDFYHARMVFRSMKIRLCKQKNKKLGLLYGACILIRK